MTVYELIQQLSRFPSDTKVVHALDWSDDVVLADYTDIADGPPIIALSCSTSTDPQEAFVANTAAYLRNAGPEFTEKVLTRLNG